MVGCDGVAGALCPSKDGSSALVLLAASRVCLLHKILL